MALAETEPGTSGLERHLEVGSYVDADWDRVGFYDETGRYEHAYAGETSGHFDYAFEGPVKQVRRMTVTARLSAESNDVGAPDEMSDVTLSLNGVELGTQTVPPDDGQGAVRSWVIEDSALLAKLGSTGGRPNQLRLEVKKDAAHQHGLCIYGRALDASAPDQGAPLTVRFEASDDVVVSREAGEGRAHETR